MKFLYFINIITVVLLLFSMCSRNNEGMLSATQMENLLYDYHLAQGIIERLPYETRYDSVTAQEILDAVYKKHGLSEEEFDSCMSYYNRHAKELNKIYVSLAERLDAESEELKLRNGNNEMSAIFTQGGDTTNVWTGANLMQFRAYELTSLNSFNIPTDSSFHKNDQIILSFNTIFFRQANISNDNQFNVGIAIKYTDGATKGISKTITIDGHHQLSIQADSIRKMSNICGYFSYKASEQNKNLAFISNISIIRMHQKLIDENEISDSLATDSILNDSVVLQHNKSNTIITEDVKSKEKKKHAKILTAPEKRTRNSYGIRRKR